LGIAGAFVGTWLGRTLGIYSSGQGAGWIASIIGAVVLLLIYRAIVGRRRSPPV
jgi:uncharacterized membrane protein YeaQ/YmgE (transglycosylase-associated protein family)